MSGSTDALTETSSVMEDTLMIEHVENGTPEVTNTDTVIPDNTEVGDHNHSDAVLDESTILENTNTQENPENEETEKEKDVPEIEGQNETKTEIVKSDIHEALSFLDQPAVDKDKGGKTDHDDVEMEDQSVEEKKNSDKKNHHPPSVPPVEVTASSQRLWHIKVHPLKHDDLLSDRLVNALKSAPETLILIPDSDGYVELFMDTHTQVKKFVSSLLLMKWASEVINVELTKTVDGTEKEKVFFQYNWQPAKALRRWTGYVGEKNRRGGFILVKNLPSTATKDNLRLLFPYPEQIIYDTEKCEASTCRLVLSSKRQQTAFLKTYIKIELGGNVLGFEEQIREGEDEKKTSEPTEMSDPKKEAGMKNKGNIEPNKAGGKANGSNKDQPKGSLTKTDKKQNQKSNQQQGHPKGAKRIIKYNPRMKPQTDGQANYRKRKHSPGNMSYSQNWHSGSTNQARHGMFNSGQRNYQMDYGQSSNFNLGMNAQGLALADAAKRAANAEATKEMVVLQNQLNQAIKNQLAMLNQTTILGQTQMAQLRGTASSSPAAGASSQVNTQHTPVQEGRFQSPYASGLRKSLDQYKPAAHDLSELQYDVMEPAERQRLAPKRRKRNKSSGGGGRRDRLPEQDYHQSPTTSNWNREQRGLLGAYDEQQDYTGLSTAYRNSGLSTNAQLGILARLQHMSYSQNY